MRETGPAGRNDKNDRVNKDGTHKERFAGMASGADALRLPKACNSILICGSWDFFQRRGTKSMFIFWGFPYLVVQNICISFFLRRLRHKLCFCVYQVGGGKVEVLAQGARCVPLLYGRAMEILLEVLFVFARKFLNFIASHISSATEKGLRILRRKHPI